VGEAETTGCRACDILGRKVCGLLGPEDAGECWRRFLSDSPDDFVEWLRQKGVGTGDLLKALDEALREFGG